MLVYIHSINGQSIVVKIHVHSSNYIRGLTGTDDTPMSTTTQRPGDTLCPQPRANHRGLVNWLPRSHPRVALPLPAGRLQAGPSRKTNMGLRPRLLWTLVGCLSLQATPTSAQKQNMCDSSPPQLCRQRCPMVTCPPPNLCGMRRGDCCDVVCLTHQEAAQTKHNQGQQRGVTT